MEDQLDFAASKDDASGIHSIASVSVISSIHDDDGDKENAATSFSDHDDDQENDDLLSPSLPKKKSVLKRRRRTSWVWKHFKDIADKKEYSLCILCNKDIFMEVPALLACWSAIFSGVIDRFTMMSSVPELVTQ